VASRFVTVYFAFLLTLTAYAAGVFFYAPCFTGVRVSRMLRFLRYPLFSLRQTEIFSTPQPLHHPASDVITLFLIFLFRARR